MSLSKNDLTAIRQIVDGSIDERVQPMLDQTEKRIIVKIDQLTLNVGQFSLETTDNFVKCNTKFAGLTNNLPPVIH